MAGRAGFLPRLPQSTKPANQYRISAERCIRVDQSVEGLVVPGGAEVKLLSDGIFFRATKPPPAAFEVQNLEFLFAEFGSCDFGTHDCRSGAHKSSPTLQASCLVFAVAAMAVASFARSRSGVLHQ